MGEKSNTEKGEEISKEKVKKQAGAYGLCQQQGTWGMKNFQLYDKRVFYTSDVPFLPLLRSPS